MFSENLKKLRERDELPQIRFAKEIGFSQAAVSAWENNTREPGIEALIRIARYFNVSVDYLIDGKNSSPIKTTPFTSLSKNEELLLKNFRKLPEDLQHRAEFYMTKLLDIVHEEQTSNFTQEKNRRISTTAER